MSTAQLTPIRCSCAECAGREWPLAELRAHPAYPPGQQINGFCLPKISKLLGHSFYYADTKAKGAWKRARAAKVAEAAPETRGEWMYGTHEKVLEMMPIDERRAHQAVDGPGEGQ